MQITIHALESNARSGDTAILNGLQVEITDAPALTGSEKQAAWAAEIREESIRLLADKALMALTKVNNGLYDAAELDAAIAKINTELMPRAAAGVSGITSAKIWIDNRGLDAGRVIQAAK